MLNEPVGVLTVPPLLLKFQLMVLVPPPICSSVPVLIKRPLQLPLARLMLSSATESQSPALSMVAEPPSLSRLA